MEATGTTTLAPIQVNNGADSITFTFNENGTVSSIEVDGSEHVIFGSDYEVQILDCSRENYRLDGGEPDSHNRELDEIVVCESGECTHETPRECFNADPQAMAEGVFKELDEALEDVFDPDIEGWEDCAGYLLHGDEYDMKHIAHLVLLTDPGFDPNEGMDFEIEAALSDAEEAGFEFSSVPEPSKEHFLKLLQIVVEYFHPVGYELAYTDGASDRHSGYCLSADRYQYDSSDIEDVTPRARMKAFAELREWLTLRGYDPSTIPSLNTERVAA